MYVKYIQIFRKLEECYDQVGGIFRISMMYSLNPDLFVVLHCNMVETGFGVKMKGWYLKCLFKCHLME